MPTFLHLFIKERALLAQHQFKEVNNNAVILRFISCVFHYISIKQKVCVFCWILDFDAHFKHFSISYVQESLLIQENETQLININLHII